MNFRKTANIWLPILIAACVVGLTIINLQFSDQFLTSDQFAIRWTAAKEWMSNGNSPYSDETYQAALDLLQESGSESGEFYKNRFIEPAYYVIFYIPLSFLDYDTAKAIWMTLIEISYFLGVLLAIKLADGKWRIFELVLISLVGLFFYPSIKVIFSASIIAPYLFLVIWGIFAATKGEGNLAGFLLLLALGMVPISLLIAIFLMIWYSSRKDFSIISIYLTGIGFFLISSIILFPGWLSEWFAEILRLLTQRSWLDTPLMRIAGFFPGASIQISIVLHLVVLIILLVEWYAIGSRDSRTLQWKLMLTLILVYLFNPTSDGAYLLWIFAPLMTVFKYTIEKWKISGKIIFWVSYLALVYLYWNKFLLSPDWLSEESSLVVLVLPLLSLLGLQWFRWWATVSPKALIDSI